ncbi:MAG: DUF6261 family protein [Tannerella sp.]|jgi:hypothetical protein|nr:DUF6261 family protein [Tannerella sp.]
MKKLILRIDLNNIRNEVWFNYFLEYRKFVERFGAPTLGIEAPFNNFIDLLQKADDTLELIRKSALTSDVTNLDVRRDNVFRGLKAVWKAALVAIEDDIKAAAERLGIVFDHFGNLASKPYSEETAGIINFIQELRSHYADDIATLNIVAMVDALEAANNEFEETILRRNDEMAARTTFKIIELRHEINRCYGDMIDRIEAQALLEGKDRFAEFISTLNANIERYKQAKRTKKKTSEL